ncbi:hypothetical protein ACFLV3_07105 [Chloroflexota bacterium]
MENRNSELTEKILDLKKERNAVTLHEFKENCLEPAKQLRQLVRNQMALADEEYSAEIADIQAVGG